MAVQLLGEMRALQLPVTATTYRTLVDDFSYRGFYQEVQALIDEQRTRGIQLNAYPFAQLLRAYRWPLPHSHLLTASAVVAGCPALPSGCLYMSLLFKTQKRDRRALAPHTLRSALRTATCLAVSRPA